MTIEFARIKKGGRPSKITYIITCDNIMEGKLMERAIMNEICAIKQLGDEDE